jgi:hypothetical protein
MDVTRTRKGGSTLIVDPGVPYVTFSCLLNDYWHPLRVIETQ